MEQKPDIISNMRAITISREYGSGGGEIAQRLAQRLGWQLVDHEIVVRVAGELGVSEEEVEAHDEYSEGIAARILSSLQSMQPAMFAISPVPAMTNAEGYQEALSRVVEGALATGHVVIVGRGGQVLLKQHRDVLDVRVGMPRPAHERHTRDERPVAVAAHDLLGAEPVLDGHERRADEGPLQPRGHALEVDALAGEDDEVLLAEVRRLRGSTDTADQVAPARNAQTLALERLRVRAATGQHAHLRDLGEMGGEETADRAGADDADAPDHAYFVFRYRM